MNPFKINTALAANVTVPEKPPYIDDKTYDTLLQAAVQDQAATKEVPVQPQAEPQQPADDTPPNLHSQILIAPNFVPEDICDEYIEYIQKQQETDLSVFDAEATNRTGQLAWEVEKETRDTQTVELEPIKEVVHDLMRHAVRDFLNPFFETQIKDSEVPQILAYHPGGHYRPHIDGETLFNDGSGTLKWVKNVDRDISLVIYLNDDYEGGEIVFPKQAISIKPRKGLLVAFPSSHHFLHGVNPVVKGDRYAIVNWFSHGMNPVQQ